LHVPATYIKGSKNARTSVTGIATTITMLEKYRDNIPVRINAIVAQAMPLTMKSIVL
jgi:hypothetical protein